MRDTTGSELVKKKHGKGMNPIELPASSTFPAKKDETKRYKRYIGTLHKDYRDQGFRYMLASGSKKAEGSGGAVADTWD